MIEWCFFAFAFQCSGLVKEKCLEVNVDYYIHRPYLRNRSFVWSCSSKYLVHFWVLHNEDFNVTSYRLGNATEPCRHHVTLPWHAEDKDNFSTRDLVALFRGLLFNLTRLASSYWPWESYLDDSSVVGYRSRYLWNLARMDFSNFTQSTLEGSLLRNDGIRLKLPVTQGSIVFFVSLTGLALETNLSSIVPARLRLLLNRAVDKGETPVRLIWTEFPVIVAVCLDWPMMGSRYFSSSRHQGRAVQSTEKDSCAVHPWSSSLKRRHFGWIQTESMHSSRC